MRKAQSPVSPDSRLVVQAQPPVARDLAQTPRPARAASIPEKAKGNSNQPGRRNHRSRPPQHRQNRVLSREEAPPLVGNSQKRKANSRLDREQQHPVRRLNPVRLRKRQRPQGRAKGK